jgi:agmatine deiminase
MPAEWAEHAATWLSWPHNRDTWPGIFDAVEPAFRSIVAALAPSETVRINVRDDGHRADVENQLVGLAPADAVVFHVVPTNDAWIRDHGAIFVRDETGGGLTALDFIYNAWGSKYPPFDLDAGVARIMGSLLRVPVESIGIVLEGGSIEVDGEGTLLTTEQCLLNENRNPALARSEIEGYLRRYLGATEILWLGDGIEGDDTDGHIDDLTRFFAPGHVITVVENDRSDPNHAPLEANRRLLADIRLASGSALEVVELPMPPPLFNAGQRLPASYANFYVANEVVLMPAFACAEDEVARAILADCFPTRSVVPVDSRALVGGLGALHCLTQQVPAIVARPTIP